ncbi:uncharacterized protein LOC118449109 [Vespa mandarinia]|uniref:uncharacterized protein LOC118449109 n=1 Tax=Vespa mandarinia TaxID=7446 RepID=UPI00161AB9BF|nr:uncharacterized protein LOC118449109 [Vespa mandarinia]
MGNWARFTLKQACDMLWSDELTNLRTVATATVRKLSRARKKRNSEEFVRCLDARRDARRALTRAINVSKKNSCRDLLDSIKDPWGRFYKLVLGKLMPYAPPVPEIMENEEPTFSEVTISGEEILAAVQKGKGRKALGLDGLPGSDAHPDQTEKDALPDSPGSYRPISVIGELGKLFEPVVVDWINSYLEETRTLSPSQNGFRSGRSTVNAVLDVKNLVEASTRVREVVILVSLDVSNAFRSLPWVVIVRAMEREIFPRYLVSITKSYLDNGAIAFTDKYGRPVKCHVSCGVLQGSTLDSML